MASSQTFHKKLISKRPTRFSSMAKRPTLDRPSTVCGKPSSSKRKHDDDMTKNKKIMHSLSWEITEETNSLPEVPLLYVPSATYAIIKEENPRNIASRITDAVAAASSTGNFADENATATISTITGVQLSVSLFKHKENSILVEVQRLSGDVIQFHYSAKEILQAAKNIQRTPRQHFKPSMTITSYNNALSHSQSQLTTPTNQTIVLNRTMENIENLLNKDRIDASVLGLESLQLLTDGSSSNRGITLEASKAVLLDGQWQDIKNFTFSLVVDDECVDDISDEHATKLRLALNIIANSLRVFGQQENQNHLKVDADEMKDLMASLKTLIMRGTEVSHKSNFQIAYHAARCLSHMLDLSHDLRISATELQIAEVIEQEIDRKTNGHHFLLNNIFDRILLCLGGVKVE